MTQEISRRHPLPSRRKLAGSVVLAMVTAAAILILLVLPAEYEIDLTGAGRLLGLVLTDEEKAQAMTFNPPLIPQTPVSPRP